MASTENGASPCLSLAPGSGAARQIQEVGARLERPVAPRRDDLDVGVERIGGKLEADLVVALAGGAVGDRVGAGFPGDLDQMLGDQRPGDRGAEQIGALIDGVGAEHREDEIADELLAHIHDADVLDAEHLGLLARRLQFAALAEIGGEGHDFRAEFGLQPFQDDGGVETAGIGEHDLLHVFPLRHFYPRGFAERHCWAASRAGLFSRNAGPEQGPASALGRSSGIQ